MRFASITFYVDPCFTELPLNPADVNHADMILATSAQRVDASLAPMLEASKRAKLILPKSAADSAHAAGIPYPRMTTTDSGLRIEYFKDNLYSRVYSVARISRLDRRRRLSFARLPDPLRPLDHLSRRQRRAL